MDNCVCPSANPDLPSRGALGIVCACTDLATVFVQSPVVDQAIVSSHQKVRTAQWLGDTAIKRASDQRAVNIGSKRIFGVHFTAIDGDSLQNEIRSNWLEHLGRVGFLWIPDSFSVLLSVDCFRCV